MSHLVVADLLLDLGLVIRRRLMGSQMTIERASTVVARTSHDTIFTIDRHVESLLIETIARWPAECLPVALFAEGLVDAPFVIGGTPSSTPKWWLLIDPIDGTRGLMYQKRSAFFLAAAAPGSVNAPRLGDVVVSVAVELPISKAGWADSYVWSKGAPVRGIRSNLFDASERSIAEIKPSTAADLSQSFGSVVAFFPEGKRQAAELAEAIAAGTGVVGGHSQIFDDQYISTGGQLVELMTGKDRFIIDARPHFLTEPSKSQLCCHPYDLAIAPLARAAGVVLLSPDGTLLDAPFALNIDVAWCGYANQNIARLVSPIVEAYIGAAPKQKSRTARRAD